VRTTQICLQAACMPSRTAPTPCGHAAASHAVGEQYPQWLAQPRRGMPAFQRALKHLLHIASDFE